MARYTSERNEIKHIIQIDRQIPMGGIVEIKLNSGGNEEGVLMSSHSGNNGGAGGSWQYYGELTLMTKNRRIINIDLLDIKSILQAWTDTKITEYENLGLIKMVDYPDKF